MISASTFIRLSPALCIALHSQRASDLINVSLDEAVCLKEIGNAITSSHKQIERGTSRTAPTPSSKEQHMNGVQMLMYVCMSFPAVADVYLLIMWTLTQWNTLHSAKEQRNNSGIKRKAFLRIFQLS